jgi:hypothetical protein
MTRVFAIVPFRMVLVVVISGDIVIGLVLGWLMNSGDAADPGLMKVVSIVIPVAVLVVVVPLVTVLMRPWRYFADMDAMRAGGAWVHWSYDEAGWTTANQVEGRRTRRFGFIGILGLLGLAVAVLLIGLVIGEGGTDLVYIGGMMSGLAIVAAAAFGGTSPAVMAKRRKRGDIYVSRLGIYRIPGGYTPMFGFGFRLENVALLTEPTPYLSFEAMVQGRAGPRAESLADVAVPPGREAEARDLANRLRTEVLGRAPA